MMRTLFALVGIAGLCLLGHHAWTTRHAAEKVMAKAKSMDRNTGPEAGEIAYRVVADRYPLSPEAFEARKRLFELRLPALSAESAAGRSASLGGDPALADAFRIPGDPFVGGLAIAVAGGFLCLIGLFQNRSRVRGRSFFFLLLLGTVAFATQTSIGQRLFTQEADRFGAFLYGVFPWVSAGVTLLAGLFMLKPVRRRWRRRSPVVV